jgi:hypothetical protein
MPYEILDSLRQLPDEDLVARTKRLAARERDATALLVAHLAELDTRDLHFRAGYSSLFAYCRDALSLSEPDAYNAVEAARAARRFPAILGRLGSGSLNLTTVRLLGPHLTAENHRAVLDSAHAKTRSEVEQIVAGISPRPDVAPSLRKLPAPTRVETVRVSGLPPHPRPVVEPLSPDRYRLQVTIVGETLEKLRLARDMLRHAIPSGDDAAILDRALSALLLDLAKAKFAATDTPRASRATVAASRHIPAEVKRAVWLRDLGCCAFVGTGGRRCGERAFVEFHHVRPFAVGGEASVENIQLRCRRHNDYEAREFFLRRRDGLPCPGSGPRAR